MTEPASETPADPAGQDQWPIIKAQPRSFFRAPLCTDLDQLDADVALIGVPFDQGTFGRPGARFGPDAVRDAPRAYLYSDPYGRQTEAEGFFDVDLEDELLRGVTMADCGNITIVPAEVVQNFEKLTSVVEKVVERGAFPVVIGGACRVRSANSRRVQVAGRTASRGADRRGNTQRRGRSHRGRCRTGQ